MDKFVAVRGNEREAKMSFGALQEEWIKLVVSNHHAKLPNVRLVVDGGKMLFLTLTTNFVRQFPADQKPSEWRLKMLDELLDLIEVEFRIKTDDEEVAKRQLWKAFTHEAHDIRNCGRMQSIRLLWILHLHLPGGFQIRGRARLDNDSSLRKHSIYLDMRDTRMILLIDNICREALSHDFGEDTKTLVLKAVAKVLHEDYPYFANAVEAIGIHSWPEPKELTYG